MSVTSYVTTGGASGVGRAVVERLSREGKVIVVDIVDQLSWNDEHVSLISGDAGDPDVATRAARAAEAAGVLTGWVNNAAIFHDAALDTSPAPHVLELITANLALTLTGCHTAVNHYLAHSRSGAIVNVSSHQAQRPVRGALPYATAKAAIEGLTRAIAVDHGGNGIRTNAVALGSISTPRFEAYRTEHPEVDDQMSALHPLGRVGTVAEVADVVRFLLSSQAGSSTGRFCPSTAGAPSGEPTPRPREGSLTPAKGPGRSGGQYAVGPASDPKVLRDLFTRLFGLIGARPRHRPRPLGVWGHRLNSQFESLSAPVG